MKQQVEKIKAGKEKFRQALLAMPIDLEWGIKTCSDKDGSSTAFYRYEIGHPKV